MNTAGDDRKTRRNLVSAYLREAAAHAYAAYAAKQARSDGLVQAARAFEETAEQKLALAKRFLKRFEEGGRPVVVELPARGCPLGETTENLRAAADDEATSQRLFEDFAATAKQEGHADLAVLFRAVAAAQAFHERRYRALQTRFSGDSPWERDEPIEWYCAKCGYVHRGPKAPTRCPACAHPVGWFEPLADNW